MSAFIDFAQVMLIMGAWFGVAFAIAGAWIGFIEWYRWRAKRRAEQLRPRVDYDSAASYLTDQRLERMARAERGHAHAQAARVRRDAAFGLDREAS